MGLRQMRLYTRHGDTFVAYNRTFTPAPPARAVRPLGHARLVPRERDDDGDDDDDDEDHGDAGEPQLAPPRPSLGLAGLFQLKDGLGRGLRHLGYVGLDRVQLRLLRRHQDCRKGGVFG